MAERGAGSTPQRAPLRLGVNIDHVATVRNARGGRQPDPVRAALLAERAGADGITAHLREDRRHITDLDITRLSSEIALPLNLHAPVAIDCMKAGKYPMCLTIVQSLRTRSHQHYGKSSLRIGMTHCHFTGWPGS